MHPKLEKLRYFENWGSLKKVKFFVAFLLQWDTSKKCDSQKARIKHLICYKCVRLFKGNYVYFWSV